MISAHCVTNKILSCDSNYTADAIVWLKFGNSSTSMREVLGALGSSSIIWDWH